MFHFSNLTSSTQPVIPVRRRYLETAHRIVIRVFDIVGSIAGIVFFAPLMAVIALSIYITSGGPILFSQQRIGKCARPFWCLKFRTMVVDAQARLEELLANDPAARAEWELEHKLHNDPRITKLGAFLRKSSLDELPQFFNVLVGDMSLVGPRPIVLDEITRYGRYFGEYCRVRPGITGLWQVSGRNDVTYRRRVALDVSYVRSRRFLANFRILMLTVTSVLMARGSY